MLADNQGMTTPNHAMIESLQAPNATMPREQRGYGRRLTVVWAAAVNFIVPFGYQDGNEFHYGAPPASPDQPEKCANCE